MDIEKKKNIGLIVATIVSGIGLYFIEPMSVILLPFVTIILIELKRAI
jgi:hypothetical protein